MRNTLTGANQPRKPPYGGVILNFTVGHTHIFQFLYTFLCRETARFFVGILYVLQYLKVIFNHDVADKIYITEQFMLFFASL